MDKKPFVLATAALAYLVAGTGVADDYQYEIGASYLDVSLDFGPSDSAVGIDFTYYFETVETGGMPLAEAAFLTRANEFNFSYTTFDDSDFDVLTLGVAGYRDDFYMAFEYLRFANGISSSDFNVTGGYRFMDDTLFTLGFTKVDDGTDFITIGAKHVVQRGDGTAFNLEASIDRVGSSGDAHIINLAGDYYFNPSFSIGGRLSRFSNGISDTGFGFGARYFFTPMFSAAVEYETNDIADFIGIRGAWRF